MTLASSSPDLPNGNAAPKARLRAEALAARDRITPDDRARRSLAAADLAAALDLPEKLAIGGFMPIRSEIDPRPLMLRLAAEGHALALPAIEADRVTMVMRRWRPGEALVEASFGLMAPEPGAEAVVPDALIVPMAAFDRRGYRIGYGAGHYDRWLARHDAAGRILTIGLAFATQEVDAVPHEPHDRHLGIIVTDREVIRTGSAG